jgi:hypothetical protein
VAVHLVFIATALLMLSTITGGIDVIWVHLVVWRLHQSPETFYEHQLHTIHALLAVVSVFLLFVFNFGGICLWLTAAMVLVWFGVEVMDMFAEKNSRAASGGLPSYEYVLHILTSGLRFAFIALIFAAKPLKAWGFSAPALIKPDLPLAVRLIALAITAGGVGVVGLHFWLMLPRFRVATFGDADDPAGRSIPLMTQS